MPAFVFARPGAYPAQDTGQNISQTINLVGLAILFFIQGPDIGGDIRESWTCRLARHIDIHPIKIFRLG
jgi:hypothetical protein